MKPILFSTPMVKAILAGDKTQTRRVVKPQPGFEQCESAPHFWHWKDCQWADGGLGMPQSGIDDYAPYQPGDILWVRETWGIGIKPTVIYKADYENPKKAPLSEGYNWKPSIHMPREAARLFLEVKDVRCERVRDISEDDAKAEGFCVAECDDRPCIKGACSETYCFKQCWDSLNAKRGYSWESSPWVWVYEFERVNKP